MIMTCGSKLDNAPADRNDPLAPVRPDQQIAAILKNRFLSVSARHTRVPTWFCRSPGTSMVPLARWTTVSGVRLSGLQRRRGIREVRARTTPGGGSPSEHQMRTSRARAFAWHNCRAALPKSSCCRSTCGTHGATSAYGRPAQFSRSHKRRLRGGRSRFRFGFTASGSTGKGEETHPDGHLRCLRIWDRRAFVDSVALGWALRLRALALLRDSSAWLDSGIWSACLGRLVDGGGVGPVRAGLPWLAGLVDDLVAPVRIGRGRTLRGPVTAGFGPVGCAGLKRPGSFVAYARLGSGLLSWGCGF